MLTKIYTLSTITIAILAAYSAYNYKDAFTLRQENQSNFVVRRGTRLSGDYINNTWRASPSRAEYPEFRGGGSGAGK